VDPEANSAMIGQDCAAGAAPVSGRISMLKTALAGACAAALFSAAPAAAQAP